MADTLVTVTDAAMEALAANASRKAIFIQNKGIQTVFVRFFGVASPDYGHDVRPGGALHWSGVDAVPTGAVSVVCRDGGESKLFITEVL